MAKPVPGLHITTRETDVLRFVVHTWLVLHSIQNRKELLEEKKKQRKPYLYALRRLTNGLVALGSTVVAVNALWHLTL
jgi:hypothetical protein